ncbi:MAG: hypothetical protein A2Y66_02470 [Nitrospirae bacterium RBG_13_41_22]|nr:MAG: hypothetical protein A2Y66_02470 [Nitrospirae bacterium RBG_13_41_22]
MKKMMPTDKKYLILVLKNMQVYQEHIKEEVMLLNKFIDQIGIRVKWLEDSLKGDDVVVGG